MNWLERRMAISDYLSKKENWTPTMIHIAREFLIIGVILGLTDGIGIGIMYCIHILLTLIP
jgi:hypothetical protein